MCGLHRLFAPLLSRTLRRIPQAVGIVATVLSDEKLKGMRSAFQYRKR